MTDLTERLRKFSLLDRDGQPGYAMAMCKEAAAEIARLQEAKRHFSALADAKGKENVALRAALESCESWVDRWTGHVGACKGGDECTCGRTAILHEARTTLEWA
jgi:hypothetical protein